MPAETVTADTIDHGVTVQYIATPTTSTMPTAPIMLQPAGQGRLPQTDDEAQNTLASIGLVMLGLFTDGGTNINECDFCNHL